MISHFDELVNQVHYQLSVRFLTTSTLHVQKNNLKSELLTAYQSKDKIKVVVDEIWNTYDVDNDGVMTVEEVRHFVQEYMPEFQSGFVFSTEVFERIYREIDDDGNGVVD